jgi:hypothetical protein
LACDPTPTPFQVRGVEAGVSVLRDFSLPHEFDRAAGPYSNEFHYVCRVNLDGHKIAIFIYEDEAEFSIDDDRIDVRFEKPAYRSSDDLISDFEKRLRQEVTALMSQSGPRD